MSSLINKVKDALSSDKHDNTHTHQTTTGTGIGSSTHGTNTTGTGYGTHGSTNAGPHDSNLANKADPRVDSDFDGRGHHNTGTGIGSSGHTTGTGIGSGIGHNTHGTTTAGPHGSNFANQADPRVDSDRDGPHPGSAGYGSSHTGVGTGNTGYGSGVGSNTHGSSNVGPHSSNLANKLDPRVDSDLDGSRNVGSSTTGGYGSSSTGAYGSSTAGHGTIGQAPVHDQTTYGGHNTSTTGAGFGTHGSSNAGPHNSNLVNKLDPRVDSDVDNRNDPSSRVGGYGSQPGYGVAGSNPTPSGNTQHGYGGDNYGTHGTTGTTGYGSNTHGTSGYGSSATPGSGNAPSTAGPHNSNLLNKLDPRVDSNLDGSKTVGGNQTHR